MGRIILMFVFGTIGTGIGFGLGFGGGFVSGAVTGTINGLCTTVDTAANQGLITPDQAEKIGVAFVKEAQKTQQGDNVKSVLRIEPPNAGAACKQFRKGATQG
ncbi:hypothetical protein LEP3755_58850 [Leptolyngbya sp. NIES-3755]|nr:hypothetical protein LEP3755_58850 [Leptolyngbya sp. NIES-3755]